MKAIFLKSFIVTITIAYSFNIQAQKIVIDDQVNILNATVDSLLTVKFNTKGITYTPLVDYKLKCNYQFAKLYASEGQTYASIENCKDKLLGIKKLGSTFNTASDMDKATLLFFALWEIIENPAEINEPISSEPVSIQVPSKNEVEANDQELLFDPSVSEHDSRYFFAPTARPLKKGELYYNTIYFLIHDIQYGISDRLSFGMGSTIIGFPFYFTTKYSIPVNEKSHFAIGDLLILGTYGADFAGNLLFLSYTYGGDKSNITIGEGLFTSNNQEVTNRKFTFVTNVNGILSLGKYFYLISENYISPIRQEEQVFKTVFNPDGSYGYTQVGNYEQQNALWFGISGIRFVTKKNSLVSWQVGLTHILNVPGKIPSPYDQSEWNNYDGSAFEFIAFPTVSFTRKFKLK